MIKTEIMNLDKYENNERNGIYGGKAGDKEGITINEEYWIVKYPKSTKGMKGEPDSCVHHCLEILLLRHFRHINKVFFQILMF